jgi:hypothetical protein
MRIMVEMWQDVGRHLREVAQEIALGERGLPQRWIRGPVDAIEVREADAVRSHGEGEGILRIRELFHHLSDSVVALRDHVIPATHRLRIDVVA